ncbi:MAG: hypothetical protein ABSD88_18905, partial [Candidatus Korobacteraceae bacterium]
IQILLCVCFAAHVRSFLDGLPYLSNFGCLPGRAGGTPISLGGFVDRALLDRHVFEFAGFENLTAVKAFNEFAVFLTGDDLHTRVLTRLFHYSARRGLDLARRGQSHNLSF